MVALGLVNLALSLWRRDFTLSTGVLVGALAPAGRQLFAAQLSPQLSRQDKIEEQDERNILVNLKTRTSAFRWTRLVSFGLMALLRWPGPSPGRSCFWPSRWGWLFPSPFPSSRSFSPPCTMSQKTERRVTHETHQTSWKLPAGLRDGGCMPDLSGRLLFFRMDGELLAVGFITGVWAVTDFYEAFHKDPSRSG